MTMNSSISSLPGVSDLIYLQYPSRHGVIYTWFEFILDQKRLNDHLEQLKDGKDTPPSSTEMLQMLMARVNPKRASDRCVLKGTALLTLNTCATIVVRLAVALSDIESKLSLVQQRILIEWMNRDEELKSRIQSTPDFCSKYLAGLMLPRWILRAFVHSVERRWITERAISFPDSRSHPECVTEEIGSLTQGSSVKKETQLDFSRPDSLVSLVNESIVQLTEATTSLEQLTTLSSLHCSPSELSLLRKALIEILMEISQSHFILGSFLSCQRVLQKLISLVPLSQPHSQSPQNSQTFGSSSPFQIYHGRSVKLSPDGKEARSLLLACHIIQNIGRGDDGFEKKKTIHPIEIIRCFSSLSRLASEISSLIDRNGAGTSPTSQLDGSDFPRALHLLLENPTALSSIYEDFRKDPQSSEEESVSARLQRQIPKIIVQKIRKSQVWHQHLAQLSREQVRDLLDQFEIIIQNSSHGNSEEQAFTHHVFSKAKREIMLLRAYDSLSNASENSNFNPNDHIRSALKRLDRLDQRRKEIQSSFVSSSLTPRTDLTSTLIASSITNEKAAHQSRDHHHSSDTATTVSYQSLRETLQSYLYSPKTPKEPNALDSDKVIADSSCTLMTHSLLSHQSDALSCHLFEVRADCLVRSIASAAFSAASQGNFALAESKIESLQQRLEKSPLLRHPSQQRVRKRTFPFSSSSSQKKAHKSAGMNSLLSISTTIAKPSIFEFEIAHAAISCQRRNQSLKSQSFLCRFPVFLSSFPSPADPTISIQPLENRETYHIQDQAQEKSQMDDDENDCGEERKGDDICDSFHALAHSTEKMMNMGTDWLRSALSSSTSNASSSWLRYEALEQYIAAMIDCRQWKHLKQFVCSMNDFSMTVSHSFRKLLAFLQPLRKFLKTLDRTLINSSSSSSSSSSSISPKLLLNLCTALLGCDALSSVSSPLAATPPPPHPHTFSEEASVKQERAAFSPVYIGDPETPPPATDTDNTFVISTSPTFNPLDPVPMPLTGTLTSDSKRANEGTSANPLNLSSSIAAGGNHYTQPLTDDPSNRFCWSAHIGLLSKIVSPEILEKLSQGIAAVARWFLSKSFVQSTLNSSIVAAAVATTASSTGLSASVIVGPTFTANLTDVCIDDLLRSEEEQLSITFTSALSGIESPQIKDSAFSHLLSGILYQTLLRRLQTTHLQFQQQQQQQQKRDIPCQLYSQRQYEMEISGIHSLLGDVHLICGDFQSALHHFLIAIAIRSFILKSLGLASSQSAVDSTGKARQKKSMVMVDEDIQCAISDAKEQEPQRKRFHVSESQTLKLIACLSALKATVPVAVLLQFLSDDVLSNTSRKLSELVSSEISCFDVRYFQFFWQVPLIEFFASTVGRRSEDVSVELLRVISKVETNHFNPLVMQSNIISNQKVNFFKLLITDSLFRG